MVFTKIHFAKKRTGSAPLGCIKSFCPKAKGRGRKSAAGRPPASRGSGFSLTQKRKARKKWSSLGKTGLFFGSFNPIHYGHLQLALAAIKNAALKNVLFVLSPQSPFKRNKAAIKLASFEDRAAMINLALQDTPYAQYSMSLVDWEKKMPLPSYTHRTLKKFLYYRPVAAGYAQNFRTRQRYLLLAGQDIVDELPAWKNSLWISQNFSFLIYPRASQSQTKSPSLEKNTLQPKILRSSQLLEPSAKAIRNLYSQRKNILTSKADKLFLEQKLLLYLSPSVLSYIDEHEIY